jgi:23S rRNA pseudouridine1911/1915/1917 synthase
LSGEIPPDEGTIESYIGRSPRDRKIMTVLKKGGKRAITHFKKIETFRSSCPARNSA